MVETNLAPYTVLIVDDVATNRALMAFALRRAGCLTVLEAESGEEALAILATTIPDCVLLDVMMPGIDGYEVCARARSDARLAAIPIIIQTALAERSERLKAFDAGASDVIAKPLDMRELVVRVQVHANNLRMARELRAYHQRMEGELAEAWALIQAMLPQPELLKGIARHTGIAFDWFIQPSSAIGGDLWSVWPLADGRVALLFADVSGHGIAAALRAFALHALLNPAPPFASDPLAIGRHLDQRLKAMQGEDPAFVALAFAVLDPDGSISYVAGGLRDALLVRKDGGVETVNLSGLPFGLIAEAPRVLRRLRVSPGDRLIVFSDALIEHFAGDVDETGIHDWIAAIACDHSGIDGLAARIGHQFLRSTGTCGDDLLITALALH